MENNIKIHSVLMYNADIIFTEIKKVVGVRIKGDFGYADIALESLLNSCPELHYGFIRSYPCLKEDLKDVDGLLVTKAELDNKLIVQDKSRDLELCSLVANMLYEYENERIERRKKEELNMRNNKLLLEHLEAPLARKNILENKYNLSHLSEGEMKYLIKLARFIPSWMNILLGIINSNKGETSIYMHLQRLIDVGLEKYDKISIGNVIVTKFRHDAYAKVGYANAVVKKFEPVYSVEINNANYYGDIHPLTFFSGLSFDARGRLLLEGHLKHKDGFGAKIFGCDLSGRCKIKVVGEC